MMTEYTFLGELSLESFSNNTFAFHTIKIQQLLCRSKNKSHDQKNKSNIKKSYNNSNIHKLKKKNSGTIKITRLDLND